jgi:hypothetical protein
MMPQSGILISSEKVASEKMVCSIRRRWSNILNRIVLIGKYRPDKDVTQRPSTYMDQVRKDAGGESSTRLALSAIKHLVLCKMQKIKIA